MADELNARQRAKKAGASDWDVGRMCWRCGNYGEPGAPQPGTNGSKIHGFTCGFQPCPNFGTGWIVQVNKDGSIPDRTAGHRNMGATEFTKAQAQADNEMGRRNFHNILRWDKESTQEDE